MAVIDVMLPYWGNVEQLKAAVRSVLVQEYTDWRLIVIDDGYPDPEPARWFGELTDERVQYLRNESNLGALGNYRLALDLVTAEHFVMMGCDDIMLPNFLRKVAEAVSAYPELAAFQPGVLTIDEFGRGSSPLGDRIKLRFTPSAEAPVLLSGESLATSLTIANWAYFPSVAWRTADVRAHGFRDGLNVVLDFALLLDIVVDGGLIVFDPELSFLYRRHSQSDSSIKAITGERFEEERHFFAEQRLRYRKVGWVRAARAAHWHLTSRLNAASLIPSALAAGEFVAAGKLLKHVFV